MNPILIRPVDPNLSLQLPAAFRSKDINPAVLLLAAGMRTHAEREKYVPQAELILNEIAGGLCRHFDDTQFVIADDDPRAQEKTSLLMAISDVADLFEVDDPASPIKSHIPVQVFEAYAFNAVSGAHTMIDPSDPKWWIRPAALHAAMIVSEFALLMHASTSKYTGQTVHHVSCCGCGIQPATVVYDIQSAKHVEIAASVTEWLLKMCFLEVVYSHREFAPSADFPLTQAA